MTKGTFLSPSLFLPLFFAFVSFFGRKKTPLRGVFHFAKVSSFGSFAVPEGEFLPSFCRPLRGGKLPFGDEKKTKEEKKAVSPFGGIEKKKTPLRGRKETEAILFF
jgi:hypothetical protein